MGAVEHLFSGRRRGRRLLKVDVDDAEGAQAGVGRGEGEVARSIERHAGGVVGRERDGDAFGFLEAERDDRLRGAVDAHAEREIGFGGEADDLDDGRLELFRRGEIEGDAAVHPAVVVGAVEFEKVAGAVPAAREEIGGAEILEGDVFDEEGAFAFVVGQREDVGGVEGDGGALLGGEREEQAHVAHAGDVLVVDDAAVDGDVEGVGRDGRPAGHLEVDFEDLEGVEGRGVERRAAGDPAIFVDAGEVELVALLVHEFAEGREVGQVADGDFRDRGGDGAWVVGAVDLRVGEVQADRSDLRGFFDEAGEGEGAAL